MKQYFMVYCIECFLQIEKNHPNIISFIQILANVIKKINKTGL